MATAAQAPVVNAEMFKSGTAPVQTEGGGSLLPRQIASAESAFGIPTHLVVAVPMGPSQTLPSARPQRLLFAGLRDPEYRLQKPIPLDVSIEESEVVLTWAEVDEFGYGPTMGMAVDDFAHTLRELYRRLHEQGQLLGPDLERVKRVLEQYIEPRAVKR